jgi:hypothetical protein
MTQRGNPNWKKGGKSPNPGGRPSVSPEDREALTKLNPRAIARLAEMLESDDERVVMQAIQSIMDRNMGKPVQPTDNKHTDGSGEPLGVAVSFVHPGEGK